MSGNFTFTIVKPDAVSKNFTGPILAKINEAGFRIVAMKMLQFSTVQAQKFYEIHKERPFYNDLVEFMTSGPVVVAQLEKENAVDAFRTLIGATNPADAADGTIRKLFAESIQNNAVHGSDSDENAAIEAGYFFSNFDKF